MVFGFVAFTGLLTGCCLVPGSQWSTPNSGPLAHGFSGLLTQLPHFSEELVVHSKEWTTSSRFFLAFGLIPALFQEARGLGLS